MADLPALCVHIGHGKTGSSFLQSAFAHSVESLAAAGVDYTLSWKLRRSARGGISSGNATQLIQFMEASAKKSAEIPPPRPGCRITLVSGETAFSRFTRTEPVRRLVEAARSVGYGRVAVLMFIRDPISHCASSYQQGVKRGGFTGTVDERADRFTYPHRVEDLLNACDGVEGLDLTVRNYSRVRRDLLGVVASWLGIPREALSAPPMAVVNRSLSNGELEFQRALNQVLGESGEILSDALCELLPDVKSNEIRPSLAAQHRLWDRIEPVVTRINARIGAEHGYQRDIDADEPKASESFVFTREQIAVIAKSLGAEIARLRARAEGDLDLMEAAVAAQGDMPENRRQLFEMARQHTKANDTAAAERALRQLIAMAPDHAAAHLALAKLLVREDRLAEALPIAERAVELSPEAGTSGRVLGAVRRRLSAA